MKQKISGNGIVGNAVYGTNSERIRIKLTGDLDGGIVTMFEWYGDGTPDLNGSEWQSFATINAAAVGSNGLDYNIGTDVDWYASVSGATSPDAYLIVSPIGLGA